MGGKGSRQDNSDGQWLCTHYKRRCHVKFSCCDKYWPCHRCHNNKVNCNQKKLKAIHTKFLRCATCATEQEVTALFLQLLLLSLLLSLLLLQLLLLLLLLLLLWQQQCMVAGLLVVVPSTYIIIFCTSRHIHLGDSS